MHIVYILRCKDVTLYVGCSKNLEKRLGRHAKGWVLATKHRLPVKLETYVTFKSKYKAYDFERYLKTGSGRAFLNKRLV